MSKYDPLRDYLTETDEVLVRLSFVEIERILGDQLPPSARTRSAWWANEPSGGRHVQARSWGNAGYQTQNLDLDAGSVEFFTADAGG